jgi:hypothetical protein
VQVIVLLSSTDYWSAGIVYVCVTRRILTGAALYKLKASERRNQPKMRRMHVHDYMILLLELAFILEKARPFNFEGA